MKEFVLIRTAEACGKVLNEARVLHRIERLGPLDDDTRKIRAQIGSLVLCESGIVAETSEHGILLRPSVTFPIEIYTDERIAEFDAADQELGRCLKRKRK